jgi:hypothetical protein
LFSGIKGADSIDEGRCGREEEEEEEGAGVG